MLPEKDSVLEKPPYFDPNNRRSGGECICCNHRDAVSALVVIESPLSGVGLEDLFASFWHFGFMASPFSELLITGKEKEFFSVFAFGDFVFRKEAFPQADIDRYIADQARPGRLKAGFAYYPLCSPAKTSSARLSHHPGRFRYSPSTGTTP
jgi:hypothetical protein